MLESALDKWKELGLTTRPRLLATFTAGKNHQTGLLDILGVKTVIKVFRHSLERSLFAQQQAAQFSLAPKILGHYKNIVLMDFIEGGLPVLEQTAIALSSLHSNLTADTYALDLPKLLEQYLQRADETLKNQHQSLVPLLEEFFDDSTPWCFCHNDLVNENCVSNAEQACFLDWEYAAQHNPWFDLAAIVLYRGFNRKQAKAFLQAYADWQHKVDDRIFLTSQITVLWADLLWHVYTYGLDYRLKNSSRFDQLNGLVDKLKTTR